MIRSVVFRREARREFDEAADWYESNQKGLGKAFTEAIQDLLRSACSNPHRHPRVFEDLHEGLVHRFPYCVYYCITNGHIVVIVVFHAARDPIVWQSRV
jgi:toxin ParE1/3/4